MLAMTPGMFLIASILRMATVVGAPDRVVDEPIHDNFLSDQWTTHRLEVEGERVYGLVHRAIPDRYAVGVCFLQKSEFTPAMTRLRVSGWEVHYTDDYSLRGDDPRLRRDIATLMVKAVEIDSKKSAVGIV